MDKAIQAPTKAAAPAPNGVAATGPAAEVEKAVKTLEAAIQAADAELKKIDALIVDTEKKKAKLVADRKELQAKLEALRPKPAAAAPAPQPAPQPAQPLPPVVTGPLSGKRVLIVDDSQIVLALLSRKLASQGLQVVTAESAKQAIEKLGAEGAFDLIVSDVEMPEYTGIQFISALRTLPKVANIPIVICSTSMDAEHHRAAERLGVAKFVRKNPDELLEVVRKILLQVRA